MIPDSNNRRARRLLTMIGVIVFTLVAINYLGILPGYIYRTEFSPDRLVFRCRNAWNYIPDPWACYEWSHPLLEKMRPFDDGRMPPENPPRWDFVQGSMKGVRGWHGNAKNLRRAIGADDNPWLNWTDENPKLANILWPRVIQLIRIERYQTVRFLLNHHDVPKDQTEIESLILELE